MTVLGEIQGLFALSLTVFPQSRFGGRLVWGPELAFVRAEIGHLGMAAIALFLCLGVWELDSTLINAFFQHWRGVWVKVLIG